MTDLSARNALFARGTSRGLTWTTGEAADGTSTIYLPMRVPQSMRASLSPSAHNWILNCTTPLGGTVTCYVDKISRDDDSVLRALAVAVAGVIENLIGDEPESARELLRFLGALGIAMDDEDALASAKALRSRLTVV